MDVPAPIGRSQSCRGSPGFNITKVTLPVKEGVPGGSDGKESACSVGDPGSIPEWGRSPGEGNGYPLQYSCLDNPRDRGAWRAPGQGVVLNNRIQLSDFHFHFSLLVAQW